MGTLPLVENVRIACADSRALVLDIDTTTGDMSMGSEGTASLYGRFDDGRKFSCTLPLSVFNERWLARLCDALTSNEAFLSTFIALSEIDEAFVIPAAPSRNLDAVAKLARMGQAAKFKDFAKVKSGRDRFSSMNLSLLEEALGADKTTAVHQKLSNLPEAERPIEAAKVMRWVMRGLPVGMAARKVAVDREVSANARPAYKPR